MYIKSVFATMTGMCSFGGDARLEYGQPFVMRRSIINCRFVSHLTASPSNSTAID